MIVELIGCDGAGKTTLARMLREQGVLDGRVVAMPHLLLDPAGLRRIKHPTALNLVQDVGGLPFFLGACRRERDYLALSAGMLARSTLSTYDKVNGLRDVVRRVGMHHLARSRASSRVVLSDEGTVLTAYLFVLTGSDFDRAGVEHFARLVPRPDKIVYVKAPVASLVRRAIHRPDRRRQHVGRDRHQVEWAIRRTVEVFDLVVATKPLRDRVLAVENDDTDPAHRQQLVEEIAAWLRESRPPAAGTSESSQLRPAELNAELRS